ncbi:class I mannose-6-phosphate isomerase [Enterovibrio nigricans]|uniref:Mannose-6-phosphate isomerase, class I n=1 Tax=Enterovibrio nigricans DSM 22720 TaxID=1121868 RepID=A0A1T4W141_9GAMM|nr:class I mannose-6-phosphate isomerase [Enterovibrio nigricans]PKF49026.1 mannose-6-phosphate isomerase [Enterovibrio nigricans]SKA70953.1 Mannose-6-phosphate isomerase, class I [Enterovibrio nigricans DSM 22720]
MKYQSFSSNYDKSPRVTVIGYDNHAWQGWSAILDTVKTRLDGNKHIVVIDTYHGVDHDLLKRDFIDKLAPAAMFFTQDAKFPEPHIFSMLERHITDDRVFGIIAPHKIQEFFDTNAIARLSAEIDAISSGTVVVYGPAASLFCNADTLIYADLARWEIQHRFRHYQLDNWGAENAGEDILRRYKRAFFIEWRVFDRHKTKVLPHADFLLDTNNLEQPKLVSGEALLAGLKQTTQQPFRLVPFFDPGVWGGQWMKEVCDLDADKPNYAWCFDCVPEENSLVLNYAGVHVEIPAQDLVLLEPRALLGENVHARFGAEFPIRFDFLDTMEGQHLSLQVHPLTEYIQQEFGMHYTQDESYYMLDAGDDACVYLGTKSGIDPDEMLCELALAQQTGEAFNDEKFINRFPAKKHDHFLIPAGTIHCSGSNAMVLEISATPYIFTFKLWDWGRLGMDGQPRPVHLDHGKEVIQWDRNTEWVEKNLINDITLIEQGDGWREERTGLHEREFIETRRHWLSKPVAHQTDGNINVLNLIEGREALVSSPKDAFTPFVVHYAETFIIPANVGEYVIQPYGESEGQTIATIKAYVR